MKEDQKLLKLLFVLSSRQLDLTRDENKYIDD